MRHPRDAQGPALRDERPGRRQPSIPALRRLCPIQRPSLCPGACAAGANVLQRRQERGSVHRSRDSHLHDGRPDGKGGAVCSARWPSVPTASARERCREARCGGHGGRTGDDTCADASTLGHQAGAERFLCEAQGQLRQEGREDAAANSLLQGGDRCIAGLHVGPRHREGIRHLLVPGALQEHSVLRVLHVLPPTGSQRGGWQLRSLRRLGPVRAEHPRRHVGSQGLQQGSASARYRGETCVVPGVHGLLRAADRRPLLHGSIREERRWRAEFDATAVLFRGSGVLRLCDAHPWRVRHHALGQDRPPCRRLWRTDSGSAEARAFGGRAWISDRRRIGGGHLASVLQVGPLHVPNGNAPLHVPMMQCTFADPGNEVIAFLRGCPLSVASALECDMSLCHSF
mmetsp:Transcript_28468/g.77089  ORF Transcript_28468/g.77089 Transcript_28468/m.77089 type:complete len:400 (+) Transcript_28468:922-2121(+)